MTMSDFFGSVMINIVDFLLVLIVLICCWTAYQRGFILSALILLSWAVALGLALVLYQPLSVLLLKLFAGIGSWSTALAFILIIIITQALFDRLSYWLLQRLSKRVDDSVWNHALGILPGLVNGYIWATLLSAVLITYPLDGVLTRSARESRLAARLAGQVSWLNERLSPVFSAPLLQLREKEGVTVSHEKTIKLQFSVKNARPRPEFEATMLRLVNQERVKRGLRPVKADPELTQVARAHSTDMLRRSYFSHYTPEGLDPFDRMKKAGVRFLTAGENIAITPTLSMAHIGLMNSPGHRANILNPAFGRLGIGILDAGAYGIMVTQNFRN
jgi:uncharacterized protein YkwD/uncharacterized membrane protein required for colicin V production